MRLLSRFSDSARTPSPPRKQPTISGPIPIQPPESKEHHVVCLPLSSHPIHPSKSDASLAERHSRSSERRKGRNSVAERPPRLDEKEYYGEDGEPRNRRYGMVFTEKMIEQFELEGKKAAEEESKNRRDRSRSASTSSDSSNEEERRRPENSRSRDRNDSTSLRNSGSRIPSCERSRMELVEGRQVRVRGSNFTLVTKRRSND